jgi:hypothetical protein
MTHSDTKRSPFVARFRAILARPVPPTARASYHVACAYKEDAALVAKFCDGQRGVALYMAEQAARRMELVK